MEQESETPKKATRIKSEVFVSSTALEHLHCHGETRKLGITKLNAYKIWVAILQ